MASFIRLRIVSVGAALLLSVTGRAAFAGSMTITVGSEPRQVFKGFGASVTHHYSRQSNAYASLSQAVRDEMARIMWGPDGADFRMLRLWIQHPDAMSAQQLASQYRLYVEDARRAQPKLIVLQAPDSRIYVFDKGRPIPDLQSYASDFCEQILRMRDDGVSVDVTGVANEPNDWEICRDKRKMVELIKHFRNELNNRGLEDVKLIAPESGSVDSIHFEYLDAIVQDGDALDMLDGLGGHTYNMGSNPWQAGILKQTGKEYWQTESSVDESWTSDYSQADRLGSIVATKILGDFNHYVSYWVYFIGYASGRMQGTKLAGGSGEEYPHFSYMYQISKTFKVGCVFRYCQSDRALPSTSMEWQYGQKPAIGAAAAVRPRALPFCGQTGAWFREPAARSPRVFHSRASPRGFIWRKPGAARARMHEALWWRNTRATCDRCRRCLAEIPPLLIPDS